MNLEHSDSNHHFEVNRCNQRLARAFYGIAEVQSLKVPYLTLGSNLRLSTNSILTRLASPHTTKRCVKADGMALLSREQARDIIDKIRVENGGIDPADRARMEKEYPDALKAIQSLRRQLAASTQT